MKLWFLSQSKNSGYDTYDSAVVAAESEEKAKYIHPGRLGHYSVSTGEYIIEKWDGKAAGNSTWVNVEDVEVEYLGEAKKGIKEGVICASFNAG